MNTLLKTNGKNGVAANGPEAIEVEQGEWFALVDSN